MTAEMTAEVYGRYTKPEIEEKAQTTTAKAIRLTHAPSIFPTHFIVLRI